MLGKADAYSGFGVTDLDTAKEFYGEKLGVKVNVLDEENGLFELQHPNHNTLAYLKPDLKPSNNTILNFQVDDIDAAVDALIERGVAFELYDGFGQDERGVSRNEGGPPIAWFRDPAGNILSVLEDSGPS